MPSAELGVSRADLVTDLDAMSIVRERLSSERHLNHGAYRQIDSVLLKA